MIPLSILCYGPLRCAGSHFALQCVMGHNTYNTTHMVYTALHVSRVGRGPHGFSTARGGRPRVGAHTARQGVVKKYTFRSPVVSLSSYTRVLPHVPPTAGPNTPPGHRPHRRRRHRHRCCLRCDRYRHGARQGAQSNKGEPHGHAPWRAWTWPVPWLSMACNSNAASCSSSSLPHDCILRLWKGGVLNLVHGS